MKRASLFVFCYTIFMCIESINAATITSTGTGGNWSVSSTWIGNSVPSASDDVVIAGNVSLNGNYSAKTLTINNGKTFTFSPGGNTLSLSGNLTNNGSFTAGDGTVRFTAGGVSGIVAFNNVTIDGKTQFNFGGNSTVNGRLKLINNADMAYSNNNHPNYGPDAILDINGTYNPSTNPFLWVNSISNTNKIAPNIVISGGTITASQGVTYLKGTFTVSNGATFNGSAGCIFMISGFQSITNNGTISLGGVTVQNGATWNVNANYSLATLRIESGATVNANSFVLTINNSSINNCGGISGIMQLMAGGTFNAGSSTVIFNPAFYSNVSADVSGPIRFTNLVVTGSNTINVPAANTVTVSGNVTVNSGATVGNTSNIVFDSTATVTNNSGGSTTFPPTIPITPTTSGTYLTGSISGNKAGAASIQAGNSVVLTGNVFINSGTSRTLTVSPGAELTLGAYTVTADTVFVYGKLNISNSAGLNSSFSRTSGVPVIVLGSGSTIVYDNSSSQIINPRSDYVNLTLAGAGTKTFAGGEYVIKGNFLAQGGSIDITTNQTSFTFSGNIDQSIKGLPYNSPSFLGSGYKTLTDTAKVTGVVTISGSANLVSNGLLTLSSTNTGTASIGPIATSANLIGDINYERFIPALRQWRFIGWPLSGNTFANSWQKSIYITGSGSGGSLGTTNSNGFDWTSTASSSLYYYDETSVGNLNAKWKLVPNTSTLINPTIGYRVFIRGDRSQGISQLNGSAYTPINTTLRGTGKIIKGDTTVTLTCSNGCTNNDGWNFVSNPYPSAIDWNTSSWVSARNSNIRPTIYIYNAAGNNYASWSPTGGSINGGSSQIGSGQSFWVKTTGTSSLTFKENYKVTNATVGFFGKTSTPSLPDNLKIRIGDSSSVFDECVVYMYTGATQGFDETLDAVKIDIGNSRIATSTASDPSVLMFNAIPHLSGNASDTIQIIMPMANNTAEYTLTFEGVHSFTDVSTQLFLVDLYSDNNILISPSNKSFSFSTTANAPGSYASNRFRLVLVTSSSPLPVNLLTFSAAKKEMGIELNWLTSSETNNKQFEVERSTDGTVFSLIGVLKGANNSNTPIGYSWIDESPENGANYYRLKQVDFNNYFYYSHTVMAEYSASTQLSVTAYPIPTSRNLTVEFNSSTSVSGSINVVNIFGQTVQTIFIRNVMKETLNLMSLPDGIYYARLNIEGRNSQSITIIKKGQ